MVALVLALLAAGCRPRPLVERAIRARGGALASLARDVEAEVLQGFPGTWRWRTAFMTPDRYAWTIFTAAEPHHYLFDGEAVRAFIGDRAVSADASPGAPLRSHARFTAVANLDALRLPGVQVASLAPAELPPGAVAGLAVVLPDGGAVYRLGFDERTLVVWASGPVRLPPAGDGELIAHFGDFRRTEHLLLPFHTTYAFRGGRLAEERALAVCPNQPGLRSEGFQAPGRLPACGTGQESAVRAPSGRSALRGRVRRLPLEQVTDQRELLRHQGEDVIQADDPDELAVGVDDRQAAERARAHERERRLDRRLLGDGAGIAGHHLAHGRRPGIAARRQHAHHEVAIRHQANGSSSGDHEQGPDTPLGHAARGLACALLLVREVDVPQADTTNRHRLDGKDSRKSPASAGAARDEALFASLGRGRGRRSQFREGDRRSATPDQGGP
jgi:hypothetical protein